MAILKKMFRVDIGDGESGACYTTSIELTSGQSDIYLLPSGAVHSIGVIKRLS